MKSNSDVRPTAIQPLGNGAYHYNYNVQVRAEEVETQTNPEGTEGAEAAAKVGNTRIVYDYDTVEVWGTPNRKDLTRAVIRSEISETEEFGLINDYNAAALGIATDEEKAEAEDRYRAYLRRVADIKAMVRGDLQAAGYND